MEDAFAPVAMGSVVGVEGGVIKGYRMGEAGRDGLGDGLWEE